MSTAESTEKRPAPAPGGEKRPLPGPGPIVIVEREGDFPFPEAGLPVMTAHDYLTTDRRARASYTRVINLCRDYSYLSLGYYSSLISEARGERVIPLVETILDLSNKSLYRFALPDLDQELQRRIRRLPMPPTTGFSLFAYFGRPEVEEFRELTRTVFDFFRCPILKLEIGSTPDWHVKAVRAVALRDLRPEQHAAFLYGLGRYLKERWEGPRPHVVARYHLAVLHNPKEDMPPSNERTLRRLVRIGEEMGVRVDLIQKQDYLKIAEYDALFIRETTALDHHTYRFAKKAAYEGLPVIDDPTSILRCTNKVYLAKLLQNARIPAPRTVILDRTNLKEVDELLGFPMVLKIPDGSFSRGVVKAESRDDLKRLAAKLFEDSDVIIAQEFMYTDFDWRVGILAGRPLFVCQYFMAKKHWQIVNHAGGREKEGTFKTYRVEDAPAEVVEVATRAAALIGNGLYGVDLKQNSRGVFVVEINDNPNIDLGIEDAVLKDELYRTVLREFIRRIEAT